MSQQTATANVMTETTATTLTLCPTPTTDTREPRAIGKKARKEQRQREAAVRRAANMAPKRGTLSERDGVTYVRCTGSRCKLNIPLDQARFTMSLKHLLQSLQVKRFDEITDDNLPKISLCTQCADFLLEGRHVSLEHALEIRDIAISEANKRQASKRDARRKSARPAPPIPYHKLNVGPTWIC